MRRLLIAAISLYQATLSPDHGPRRRLYPHGFCRFHPTCSDYAKTAILNFGAGPGTWLALKRLARCHPWSAGGLDPVRGLPNHHRQNSKLVLSVAEASNGADPAPAPALHP